jgi:hypothetical protein
MKVHKRAERKARMRFSLPGDMGDCMDSLFFHTEKAAQRREDSDISEFLNDVEAVTGGIVQSSECIDVDKSLAEKIYLRDYDRYLSNVN